MPMLSAAQAGPLGAGSRGNQDAGGPIAVPMKPCPACMGEGQVDANMDTQSLIAQMEQAEMQGQGPGQAPPMPGQAPQPTAPPPSQETPGGSPMDADRQRVRDYSQNRPSRFSDQPIDEEKVLADGARIRDRMRRPGMFGRP